MIIGIADLNEQAIKDAAAQVFTVASEDHTIDAGINLGSTRVALSWCEHCQVLEIAIYGDGDLYGSGEIRTLEEAVKYFLAVYYIDELIQNHVSNMRNATSAMLDNIIRNARQSQDN